VSFFDNLNQLLGQYPLNDGFMEGLRKRVEAECSKVPVHLHRRAGAQQRLEIAACEAITAHWQESFPDAWFPITMRPDWPWAHCIIRGNKAVIEFSIGPETDGHRGGREIEPVEINVQRAPANIITRTLRRFERRDLKAEREPEPAPTGTADGRPELKLTAPLKQPVTVAATPARPAPTKPTQTQKPVAKQGKPIPPGMKR